MMLSMAGSSAERTGVLDTGYAEPDAELSLIWTQIGVSEAGSLASLILNILEVEAQCTGLQY
jgi:hypothetical protein